MNTTIHAKILRVKGKDALILRMEKLHEIAARLKVLRGELSQEDFAAKIGVSFRTYQYYEGGVRSPKWNTLANIAKVCHTTVDWILTGKEGKDADRVHDSSVLYSSKEFDEVHVEILDLLVKLTKDQKRQVLRFIEGFILASVKDKEKPAGRRVVFDEDEEERK